jgi:hypothetical protein
MIVTPRQLAAEVCVMYQAATSILRVDSDDAAGAF